ncbi:hypothetical protein ACVRXQ_03380 [Streptococcus panodentis]|uniref:Uncharacterized protein n=1 Tax=Streptococcus panodentis TaxID=1581472 RepID=A0ABS5B0T9_9STRE|nr:hypothetical protein [Streptococcus panodentis]KXT78030.1 hypothetical protein STRDD11_02484 [Streptococcus sp. DD11]MBP2621589.1 hypothetical protein [Streptococcus panodentis]
MKIENRWMRLLETALQLESSASGIPDRNFLRHLNPSNGDGGRLAVWPGFSSSEQQAVGQQAMAPPLPG